MTKEGRSPMRWRRGIGKDRMKRILNGTKISKDKAKSACTMLGTGGLREASCSLGGGGTDDHWKGGTIPLSTGLGSSPQNPRSAVTLVGMVVRTNVCKLYVL